MSPDIKIPPTYTGTSSLHENFTPRSFSPRLPAYGNNVVSSPPSTGRGHKVGLRRKMTHRSTSRPSRKSTQSAWLIDLEVYSLICLIIIVTIVMFIHYMSLDLTSKPANDFIEINEVLVTDILVHDETSSWCESTSCYIHMVVNNQDSKIEYAQLSANIQPLTAAEKSTFEIATKIFNILEYSAFKMSLVVDDFRPANDFAIVLPIPMPLAGQLGQIDGDPGVDFLYKIKQINPFDSDSLIETYSMADRISRVNITEVYNYTSETHVELRFAPLSLTAERLQYTRTRYILEIVAAISDGAYSSSGSRQSASNECLSQTLLCPFLYQNRCEDIYRDFAPIFNVRMPAALDDNPLLEAMYYNINLGTTYPAHETTILSMHAGSVDDIFEDSRTGLMSIVLTHGDSFTRSVYSGFSEVSVTEGRLLQQREEIGSIPDDGFFHVELMRTRSVFMETNTKERVNAAACVTIRQLDIQLEIEDIGGVKDVIYSIESNNDDSYRLTESCVLNAYSEEEIGCARMIVEKNEEELSVGGLAYTLPYRLFQRFSAQNFAADTTQTSFRFRISRALTLGDWALGEAPFKLTLRGLSFEDGSSFRRYSDVQDILEIVLVVPED